MEYFYVIKPNGINNRQLNNGSYLGEGNIATMYLADVRLQSVCILLTDLVIALRLSAKCNMARFGM
jgi:hypothetical protein